MTELVGEGIEHVRLHFDKPLVPPRRPGGPIHERRATDPQRPAGQVDGAPALFVGRSVDVQRPAEAPTDPSSVVPIPASTSTWTPPAEVQEAPTLSSRDKHHRSP